MDRKYGKSWHCIIGEGFGFNVTYEMKNVLYMFYNGTLAILVFKGAYTGITSTHTLAHSYFSFSGAAL